MILIKSFLTGISYDRFKLIYANLNDGDKVRECYSPLILMMQVHFQVVFFTKTFVKHVSLKRFF